MMIMEQDFVVGVDIGAQTTKIGVVDRKGNVVSEPLVIRSDSHTDEYLYFADLTEAINKIVAHNNATGKVKGVGIGAPNGNYYKGTIEYAPNLTWGGDKTINVSEILTQKLGLTVTLTNDANAAAVGEMTLWRGHWDEEFYHDYFGYRSGERYCDQRTGGVWARRFCRRVGARHCR